MIKKLDDLPSEWSGMEVPENGNTQVQSATTCDHEGCLTCDTGTGY